MRELTRARCDICGKLINDTEINEEINISIPNVGIDSQPTQPDVLSLKNTCGLCRINISNAIFDVVYAGDK